MKIKGWPVTLLTECGAISGDGSVAEVSPRALVGSCEAGSVAAVPIAAVLGGFCARTVAVVVVDVG